LFRGNRSTKQYADGFDVFASPHYPVLLEAEIAIKDIAGHKEKSVNTRFQVSQITK